MSAVANYRIHSGSPAACVPFPTIITAAIRILNLRFWILDFNFLTRRSAPAKAVQVSGFKSQHFL